MAHTHPRAKTTYMTNPYHIWTLSILTNIHVAEKNKKQRMANTHLSIETTYIASPICYTMMLPNMPFRKADAHPLRLNTRCKDLTLVPSSDTCGNSGASDSSPPSLICSLASWRPKRPNKQAMSCVLKIWQASKKTSLMSLLPKMHQIYIYIYTLYIHLFIYIYIYIIYNIYI